MSLERTADRGEAAFNTRRAGEPQEAGGQLGYCTRTSEATRCSKQSLRAYFSCSHLCRGAHDATRGGLRLPSRTRTPLPITLIDARKQPRRRREERQVCAADGRLERRSRRREPAADADAEAEAQRSDRKVLPSSAREYEADERRDAQQGSLHTRDSLLLTCSLQLLTASRTSVLRREGK